jgi:hypothetical protein
MGEDGGAWTRVGMLTSQQQEFLPDQNISMISCREGRA